MADKPIPTSDEKLWAALAHASAILPLFGPIIPVIVWFTQRKHSTFARFHALQAMAYQALCFWLWIGLVPVVVVILYLIMIPLMLLTANRSDSSAFLVSLLPFSIWVLMLGLFGAYVLLGFIGAVAVLIGRDFRYPLVGGWLARYVAYTSAIEAPISEEKEDFVVAAVSHSTCVLVLWGIFTPLVLWITEKDRSSFLRFQALQAAIYQALGAGSYIILMAGYFVFFFVMIGAALASPSFGRSQFGDAMGMLFAIPSFCLAGAFLILGPLYQLFGFIASLRVLRGHNYRYPILGGILARRIGRQQQGGTESAK